MFRSKAAWSKEKETAGIAASVMLVFYLQTHSIKLPTSLRVGVRDGQVQAFGPTLKKSVTH